MYSNPLTFTQAAASQPAQSTANSSTAGSGIDGMFMQLLITQLQNQDPLQPMDPSTFVSQLVEVNSLDQVTQINQLLQSTLGQSSASQAGGH